MQNVAKTRVSVSVPVGVGHGIDAVIPMRASINAGDGGLTAVNHCRLASEPTQRRARLAPNRASHTQECSEMVKVAQIVRRKSFARPL